MAKEQNKIGYGIRPLPKTGGDSEAAADRSAVGAALMVILGVAAGLVIGWLVCHPGSGVEDLVRELKQ